jgi:hypothetical protein
MWAAVSGFDGVIPRGRTRSSGEPRSSYTARGEGWVRRSLVGYCIAASITASASSGYLPRTRRDSLWSAGPNLTRSGQTALLALDVCRLVYRPPLLNVSPLQSDESFGRMLVMRGNFEPQIHQPFLHPWISQGVGDRCIELVDDRFRRRLGRPKPVPERRVESGQSGLIRGRNCGRHSKTLMSPRRP